MSATGAIVAKQWYIVHTYSRFEKKVAESLLVLGAGRRAATLLDLRRRPTRTAFA